MELQRIASNQVNFQANNTPSAKPKEKVTQEQAKKYAIGALAALALVGTTAMVIHRIRKGKGADIVEEGKKAIDEAQEVARRAMQSADERAQEAVQNFTEGGNYGKIRKEATRNLKKPGKKQVRAALTEAHNSKLAQEAAQRKINTENMAIAQNGKKAIGKANQGMKKANLEEVSARVQSANEAAADAKKAADKVQEQFEANKTRKNRIRAQHAHNEAEASRVRAKQIAQNAETRKAEIAKKEANRQATQAAQEAAFNNLTPEEQSIRLAKQEEALAQGARTTLSKFVKQKTAHGKMTEREALELFANDQTKTELARKIAQERLSRLK